MMEFLTYPDVRVLSDDNFVLLDDFIVKYYDHYITVPKGFDTDFASVPRVPIFYALFGGKAKKSAVLHDYLYVTKPFSREECDKAFLCAMETEGLGWFTRHAMYRGVRLGGGAYWSK
jgi:hypothetical protein